ncbi:ABC transporter ATP-binding protein [Fervidobacterium riparium]
MNKSAFVVESLSFSYSEKPLLKDLSVLFHEGKITSILGPNGSGKSTLLHILGKYLSPKDGTVYLNGKELRSFHNKELSKILSILFQKNHVFSDITVEELILQGRHPHKNYFETFTEEDRKLTEKYMKLCRVHHLKDKSITKLSGGEQQRVWLAFVLVRQPKVLLLDEPTTYLDIRHQLEILNIVRELNRKTQTTVIMVLHDINHAIHFSDYLIFLKDGKLIAHGIAEELNFKRIIKEVYNVNAEILTIDGSKYIVTRYLERGENDENSNNVFELDWEYEKSC